MPQKDKVLFTDSDIIELVYHCVLWLSLYTLSSA